MYKRQVYIVAHTDSGGQLLSGKSHYRIHFAKSQIPPVKAFWSMSLYDNTNNLVDNSLNRYSLGDRSPGLVFNPDGSLTLYVGHELPEGAAKSNWLPAPADEFYLVLRAYLPGKPIVDQIWEPPAVVRQ